MDIVPILLILFLVGFALGRWSAYRPLLKAKSNFEIEKHQYQFDQMKARQKPSDK
ncbi:hypothetical protein VCR14J2_390371 [Vibrio coralliirubri]|uniref:hypothetical protein n=1 Tax=Vibrio coralliirubri TaxID=1516159 RepID=UPI0006302006|nr:hypothetical protein [Vibrio coralliirubri]CDU05755.1 hypothetical protein VCR14J2_390371 [Vibrio coralliirubri]